jgi:hypothetical protein
MERYLNIATMGNVDSGKSTLSGFLLRAWSPTNINEIVPHNIVDSLQFERENLCTWNIAHGYGSADNLRFHIRDDPGHLDRFDITVSGLMASELVLYTIDPEKFDPRLFDFHVFIMKWLGKTNVLFLNNLRDNARAHAAKAVVSEALDFYDVPEEDVFEFNLIKIFTESHLQPAKVQLLNRILEKALNGGKSLIDGDLAGSTSVFLWKSVSGGNIVFDDQYPKSNPFNIENLSDLLETPIIEIHGSLKVCCFKKEIFAEQKPVGFGLLVDCKTSEPIGLIRF